MPSAESKQPLANRYEFVYLFDVADGNPNGDPDAGNAPRVDPETGQGLVTDVCLKRKVRNFVQLTRSKREDDELVPEPGYEIYVKERGILANEQRRAYKALEKEPDNAPSTVKAARAWMCKSFYDVRAFGAVMSTGKTGEEDVEPKAPKAKGQPETEKRKPPGPQKLWNCGQVRGPIQLSFARSVDPILNLEHAITRVALTNPGDTKRGAAVGDDEAAEATSGQFGRKSTIPYALYRTHGFISPFLARDTGFSEADLDLLWEALQGMFDHDRSASRGQMTPRAVIVFKHDSALGNAPAHALLERVRVVHKVNEDRNSATPPRSFADYEVIVDDQSLPEGVTVTKLPAAASK
jgi:CRISPR-associated protein Csd2